MVIQACNPNTKEFESRGSGIQCQPSLHSDTLSQINK
jgi:hypothetical protein